MDEKLAERVRHRANHACEYCFMPQVFYPTVLFPIDHIIAPAARRSHDLQQSCTFLSARQQSQGAEYRRD
jgi:hypothetical protein